MYVSGTLPVASGGTAQYATWRYASAHTATASTQPTNVSATLQASWLVRYESSVGYLYGGDGRRMQLSNSAETQ